MFVNEIELEEQLKEAGNKLLDPPSSIDELLNMLDKLEHLLITVEQAPSRSMQDALLPPMKALISNSLLRNSDADVKASVASCISEITRITAPDAPYNDDRMKEIFQLMVAAIQNLSNVSSRSYTKAVSILDTIAKVRSCLVMLDLELDELIIKMFQHFFKAIRSHHPHTIFWAMETTMTLIIDESDDISVGLLTSLLASVKKENQDISPAAWKLGIKVLSNCSDKLKPYLKEVLQSESIIKDDYVSIVASICGDESHTSEHAHVNGSAGHLETKGLSLSVASHGEVFQAVDDIPKSTSNGNGSIRNTTSKVLEHCSVIQQSESIDALCDADPETNLDMEPGTVTRKRGRKPNSLMNPEEGYDHSWIFTGTKTGKLSQERKPRDKDADLQSENALSDKAMLSSAHVTELAEVSRKSGSVFSGSHPKKCRQKKSAADTSSLHVPKEDPQNSENEEKTASEDEVSLRKLSEGGSNEGLKQCKNSRKIVTSDEKAGVPGRSKRKPSKSTKLGSRNINKDSSLDQTDIRKRNLVCGVSNVGADFAEASTVKKIKSSDRDGSSKEEITKTNLKRKRTPRKEVPSQDHDLNLELIGKRIKVWWPLDKMFYNAVVDSYDPRKKKFRVLYEDGDEEILNLKKQRWELIEDDICNKKLETDIREANSSDKAQKGKGLLAKSELAKQLKVHRKRSGARSISKREDRSPSSKSGGGIGVDENGMEGECDNSNGSLNIISIKTEVMTPENGSPLSHQT